MSVLSVGSSGSRTIDDATANRVRNASKEGRPPRLESLVPVVRERDKRIVIQQKPCFQKVYTDPYMWYCIAHLKV